MRNRVHLLPLLALLLLPIGWLTGSLAESPTQSAVETALTCQCGCGLTVHSCNHLNCGSAIPLKKEIGEQIAMGRSLPEIERHFEKKYGEKILSAPTTRGFNLIAWVLPFALIGSGLVVGVVVLWGWRRSDPTEEAPSASGPNTNEDPHLAEMRAKLERELRERDT